MMGMTYSSGLRPVRARARTQEALLRLEEWRAVPFRLDGQLKRNRPDESAAEMRRQNVTPVVSSATLSGTTGTEIAFVRKK